MNLNEVDIDTKEMPDSKLQLSESLGVVLSPPKASVQQKLDSKDEQASFFAILKSCIEQIYDEDNVYDMIDYSETEVDEFVESLTVSQIEMIGEWLQSIPSLKHDIDCKCPVCGTKQRVELKGLENFF